MQSATKRAATAPGRSAATDFLADGYLAHLLSYSPDTLSKEPRTLKSQRTCYTHSQRTRQGQVPKLR